MKSPTNQTFLETAKLKKGLAGLYFLLILENRKSKLFKNIEVQAHSVQGWR